MKAQAKPKTLVPENNKVAKHYWLAAVVISFMHNGEGIDTTVNVIVNNPSDQFVTESMISNVQVQAQIQLATSLGSQPDVSFVHIGSINYLGYMTETQFLDRSTKVVKEGLNEEA